MMKSTVIPLRKANDPLQVGGKAATLGRLLRAGISVPDGVAVSVAAYEEHCARAFAGLARDAGNEQRASAILTTPISATLVATMRAVWPKGADWPVAVRSSATFEDAVTSSCAGQFESFLDLPDEVTMVDAIRKCWSSFWSTHARAYANRGKLSADGGMGVIVQSMVHPQFAGVAFTEDPTAAGANVAYVEWVEGSGEALVSGETIAGRVWLDASGKVLRVDQISEHAAPPAALWTELAILLRGLASVLDGPQDIEWAWGECGRIVLLQSRPITIRFACLDEVPAPWELAGRPPSGWNDDQRRLFDCWDEYNPPAVRPLEMDLFMGATWQASLDMLGGGPAIPRIEAATICVAEVPIQLDPAARRQLPATLWPRGEAQTDLETTLHWGSERVRDLRRVVGDVRVLTSSRLLELIEECAAVHRTLAVTRLRLMHTWIEGEIAAKEELSPLIANLGEDPELMIEELVAGLDHETSHMNRDLVTLARRWRSLNPVAQEEALTDFLNRYGHFHSDGLLLAQARESVHRQVELLAAQSTIATPTEALQRANKLASDLRTRLDLAQRVAFDQSLASLRNWLVLREDSKTQVEVARPLLLVLVAEAGRRLAAAGALSSVEDIWLLRFSEICAAMLKQTFPATSTLQRRAALVHWKTGQSWLPSGFLSESCRLGDTVWRGMPGSPGIASGPARVVRGPHEFGDVRPGDIVVARATNPVWTQLFSRIAGIVVENGSRLSHASVVAREYGIPAVVGLPCLLSAVRDGEILHLDGNTGEVRRQ